MIIRAPQKFSANDMDPSERLSAQKATTATHSYMRYPSPAIMENVYKKWIIGKIRGLQKFGLYDKSKFSDIPLDSSDDPQI
jgi:hypothetical protein